MKKGISIWSFGSLSLKESFMLAKKSGFSGVEVALAESGEINLNSSEKDLKAIAAMAADCGIELYSLASGLYWDYLLTSGDSVKRAKGIQVLNKQLETAAILGCKTILCIPGAVGVDFLPCSEVVEYDTAYERAFEAISSAVKKAESLKVEIGIENVWNKFLLSPLEMRDFIDKFNSPYVGSYFDVGNTILTGYPQHWIKILGKRIKKVHFKDYRRTAGGLHGFVDLLAGDVDYDGVVSALKNAGYDGYVTAEMIPNYNSHNDVLIKNTSTAMDAILKN